MDKSISKYFPDGQLRVTENKLMRIYRNATGASWEKSRKALDRALSSGELRNAGKNAGRKLVCLPGAFPGV